ncbi:hypothetical protein [Clostridium sp. BSD9I1]|uniref:hypothetical protein n=1 Tax=Clostridium sp. BSD9I1 TaxID=2003589 RepID=UPI0016494DDD|nr:hypothetical protein [Clostridium sp. BSD9I1]
MSLRIIEQRKLSLLIEEYKNNYQGLLRQYLNNNKMLSRLDLLYCASQGIYIILNENGGVEFKEHKSWCNIPDMIKDEIETSLCEIKEDIFSKDIPDFETLFNIIYNSISGIYGVNELMCYDIALRIGATNDILPKEYIM